MNELENAYECGKFGVSRRTFVKIATAAGVTAMGGMLVFPREAHALYTEPTDPHWETLDGDKIRFTVHSDTHFTKYDMKDKFSLAFKTIYEQIPDVQAHVFDGDTTENGADSEYDDLVEYFNAHIKKPPIICMGNHEMYAHGGNLAEAIQSFKDKALAKLTIPSTPQAPGGTHDGREHFAGKIGGENGYWVIAASCGLNYDYGYQIPTEGYDAPTPVQWMIQNIEAAVQEDKSKPVFLFTHHPMPETVHYSPENFGAGWIGQFNDDIYSDQYSFREYLRANFPQVIHFSGHTHIPDNDPRSIWQDGFTAVQTATFGNAFWMEGGTSKDGYDKDGGTGGFPADGQDASQCLLVEVDPSNEHEVTIRRMDFREGAYIGRPWTFKVTDKSTWIYGHDTMAAASLPPIVDENTLVEIPSESISETSASFTIPANRVHANTSGLEDDVVMSYRITLHEADNPEGEAIYDACFMSDYYLASQNRPESFTRPLFGAALQPGTEYILTAYARNPWAKESKIGESVKFSTASKEIAPLSSLLALDFSQEDASDLSDFAHTSSAWGSPSFVSEEVFGKQVVSFDGSSAFGYDFTEEDYDKLATSTTIEILFRFEETPSSGYVDLFSSGESTGQWLEYYPDATLRHYFNDGSTCTQCAVAAGVWTHIVASYDGSAMKIYRNGVLEDEVAISGAIQPPRADALRWFVGSDVSNLGEAQAQSKARVAFANLYHGAVPAADEVAAMYAEAAPCTIALPDQKAFEGAKTGSSFTIPTAHAVDQEGNEMSCKPLVSDAEGKQVCLTQNADGDWAFTPSSEGEYQATYSAGWSIAAPITFVVVQGGTTNPDEPGDGDGGDGSDEGEKPDDSGNGNNGSGQGSDSNGDSQSKPDNTTGTDSDDGGKDVDEKNSATLPKTSDPTDAIVTAAGSVAAIATMAIGALGSAAKKLGFTAEANQNE